MEKKEIEVAVSWKQITTTTKTIELPESPTYYSMNDDGRFMPRGLVLFAIIPKYPNSTSSFTLVQVERGNQQSNDFVPTKDCRQEYWLGANSCPLRKVAFDIFSTKHSEFKEISQVEFEQKRIELLDNYKRDIEYASSKK